MNTDVMFNNKLGNEGTRRTLTITTGYPRDPVPKPAPKNPLGDKEFGI